MAKLNDIDLAEIHNILDKLAIDKSAINRSVMRLEDVLNALDRFTEAMQGEVIALREEGLTEDEETKLAIGLTRLRNATIIKYCDML